MGRYYVNWESAPNMNYGWVADAYGMQMILKNKAEVEKGLKSGEITNVRAINHKSYVYCNNGYLLQLAWDNEEVNVIPMPDNLCIDRLKDLEVIKNSSKVEKVCLKLNILGSCADLFNMGNNKVALIYKDENNNETIMPDVVTVLGAGAFKNKSLDTGFKYKNLEYICNRAFRSAYNVPDIDERSKLKYIGRNSFFESDIRSIDSKSNLEYIGSSAFAKTQLRYVNIESDKLDTIDNSAFMGNTKLKEVTFKGNVREIGLNAFYGCSNLEKVSISGTCKEIESGCFLNCKSLKVLDLPDSIEIFDGASVINGCNSLEVFKIPLNVKQMDDCRFDKARNLKKLYIPTQCYEKYKEVLFLPLNCMLCVY